MTVADAHVRVTVRYRLLRHAGAPGGSVREEGRMTGQLHCPTDARRDRLRDAGLNGIDWLEVLASKRTLLVHCFDAIPPQLGAGNVRIDGGVRVRDVGVEWAARGDSVGDGLLRPDEQARVAALGAAASRALVVRADSSRRLLHVHAPAGGLGGEGRGAARGLRPRLLERRLLLQGRLPEPTSTASRRRSASSPSCRRRRSTTWRRTTRASGD